MATPDTAAFPHLLDSIIEHSNRSLLAVFCRINKSSRAAALPLLYPEDKLFDPFPALSSTEGHDTTISYASDSGSDAPITSERIQAKIQSFLTCPHLPSQIVITQPEVLAGHLEQVKWRFTPMERRENTITTIWVNPFVEKTVIKPSHHLVLYAPPSAGVDISSLILAASIDFEPPTRTRKLTIIVAGGENTAIDDKASISAKRIWDEINLVFLPDTAPLFPTTEKSDDIDTWLSNHLDFLLQMPLFPLWSAEHKVYQIIGLEGMDEYVKTTIPGIFGMRNTENRTVKYTELADWREQTKEKFSWLEWE